MLSSTAFLRNGSVTFEMSTESTKTSIKTPKPPIPAKIFAIVLPADHPATH